MGAITPLESWAARKLNLPEPLDAGEIQFYQLQKLRETIALAKSRSQFYQKHLAAVDPLSIQTKEDVARIPLTDAAMLAADPNEFLCVSPRGISRIVTLSTSGTTGRPKRLAFTPEDQESIVDFFDHGMRTFTQPSDKVVIFLPGNIEGSVGDLLKRGLARFNCEGIVFGPIANYGEALKMLLKAKADCAVGIPSQLLALSRHQESGYSGKDIRLKSVLLSTDYCSCAIADALAEAWRCDVYDHYGMTEMGLGGAVECSARSGYHLREADLFFEIIHPDTGEPVRDGEYGEIVFSTLTRRGMPLIRYRTGDRSRFLTEPCPCGSVLKRMERIAGRINEALYLKDGSSFSIATLDEILLRDPLIAAYEAEMCVRNNRDCLVLKVHAVQGAADARRVYSELSQHSSFGTPIKEGFLVLDVREGNVEFYTSGTSKRFIADKRRT